MLEVARRELRGLLQFLEKAEESRRLHRLPGRTQRGHTRRPARHYARDELGALPRQGRRLPQATPGPHRFAAAAPQQATNARRPRRVGADAYRQRCRRAADIDQAKEQSHGLGLFIRSLVGLDREAALEAFGALPRRHASSPPTRSASSTSSSTNSPPTASWNRRAFTNRPTPTTPPPAPTMFSPKPTSTTSSPSSKQYEPTRSRRAGPRERMMSQPLSVVG